MAKIEINKEELFQFDVYNCLGHLIYKGVVENETKFPASGWQSGLYVLKIAGKGYRILISGN